MSFPPPIILTPFRPVPNPSIWSHFKQELVGRRRGVDDNAIGSGHQDAGLALREDLNRLCNGHGTETTGVEDVDFPPAAVFEAAGQKFS